MQKRDLKVGATSAALSALAFVAVYEGKVAVSQASARIDLAAGEGAEAGPSGLKRAATLRDGQSLFDATVADQSSADSPFAKANENLVAQVGEYRRRLEAIAAQKTDLEQKLEKTEAKLAAQTDGGRGSRSEWDLSHEDWAELAKQGVVKFRTPCTKPQGWTYKPDKLAKLGLAPQDGEVLRDAYERSHKRLWGLIKPLCQQALGSTEDIVEKIGLESCPHLIYDVAIASDKEAAAEAHTQAAEIRAGLRPEPGPNERVHPVLKMFLVLTGATSAFEADLAKSLGPEEAHRITYSDDMCNSNSRWGGGKTRE